MISLVLEVNDPVLFDSSSDESSERVSMEGVAVTSGDTATGTREVIRVLSVITLLKWFASSWKDTGAS